MPAPLDFTPSIKKIERAKSKLAHVEALLNAYSKSVPYTARFEEQGDKAYLIARRMKPFPEEVQWEIVEAVGHIRGALDKMVVALVDSGGRGTSGVSFPFGGMGNGKPEPFPTARHDGLRKKLTSDQWDLLIAQKPYPGGNDLLWAINEIANSDKHRKDLVEIVPAIGLRNFNLSGGTFMGGFSFGGNSEDAVYDKEFETVLMSCGRIIRQPNISTDITFRIVFANVFPVQGHEVLGLTHQQISLCESIVQIFHEAFG